MLHQLIIEESFWFIHTAFVKLLVLKIHVKADLYIVASFSDAFIDKI